MKTRYKVVWPLTLAIAATSVAGNDDLFGSSDDASSVFDTPSLISEQVDNGTNLADELLMNAEGIALSGDYQWQTRAWLADHPQATEDVQIDTKLTGHLKLDARPDADYRALLNIDYQIDETQTTAQVREAFADVSLNDHLFLRAGQQTLSWGVGYFFSPADTLNQDVLNAADPDAERIGTMAIKAQLPIDTSNYYFYALPKDAEDSVTLAAKGEWLLGGSEVSVGVVRHADARLNGVLTASVPTALGDFFAEYTATIGEQSVLVDADGQVSDRSETWLHQATAGLTLSEDVAGFANVRASGQYFYNGLGYEHALWTQNPMQWFNIAATQDVSPWLGQHYGAARLSLNELFNSDVSVSVLALGDLTDQSIMLTSTLTYAPSDFVELSASVTQLQGDVGASYARAGDMTSYTVTLTLAQANF